MRLLEEKFQSLRETISLAQSAWPGKNSGRLLLKALGEIGQLIELRAMVVSLKEFKSEADYTGDGVENKAVDANLEAVSSMILVSPPNSSMDMVRESRFGMFQPQKAVTNLSPISPRRLSSPLSSRIHTDTSPTSAVEPHVELYGESLTPRKRMIRIRQLFKVMDINRDSLVDWHEFSQLVTSELGINIDEAHKLFQDVDKNSSGKISLSEFDTHIRHLTSIEAKTHFLNIAGSDKVINRKLWNEYCKGRKMSKRDRDRIWSKMDADKSNRVTYSEFDNYVLHELASGVLDTWFLS